MTFSCNNIHAVDNTYKSPGFHEGLILKVSGDSCVDTLCTTTSIENHIRLKENRILVYPNPTRSTLQLELSDEIPLPALINLYDLHGRPLLTSRLDQSHATLDNTNMPAGIYYLVANSNGAIMASEMVVKME